MNSDSLSKARTRVGKKLVLLVAFALVVLAFVATPLTALADCNGNDNGGNNNGGNNNNDIRTLAERSVRNNTGGARDAVIQKKLDELRALEDELRNLENMQSTKFATKLNKFTVNSAATDAQIIAQFIKTSSQSRVRLTKLNGNPLKLSSVTTKGQQFKIKVTVNGNTKTLDATYLGNGLVHVTLPDSKKVIVPLSNL